MLKAAAKPIVHILEVLQFLFSLIFISIMMWSLSGVFGTGSDCKAFIPPVQQLLPWLVFVEGRLVAYVLCENTNRNIIRSMMFAYTSINRLVFGNLCLLYTVAATLTALSFSFMWLVVETKTSTTSCIRRLFLITCDSADFWCVKTQSLWQTCWQCLNSSFSFARSTLDVIIEQQQNLTPPRSTGSVVTEPKIMLLCDWC